jgi:hypothetical protein
MLCTALLLTTLLLLLLLWQCPFLLPVLAHWSA